MFVKDILPDLQQALGHCTDDVAYRRLSDAYRLLTTEGLIDSQTGEVSVCVCGNFVTLPTEVQTVLGITVDSVPAIIRDEWFSYHINGPGHTAWTPFSFADILGTNFPTIREPSKPVKLAAKINSPNDSNKILRVYGFDDTGERLMGPGANGTLEDGFLVPTVWNRILTNPDMPLVSTIERIYKDDTQDRVELLAVDPDTDTATSLLGRYRPKENTPRYTRIRVPQREVVRIKFKRRNLEVTDEWDWIPIDNREALIHAIRAVKYRWDGKYTQAREAEAEAIRMVKNDTNSNSPGGIKPPQVINNELPRETAGSSMFYGASSHETY